jgi:menaquinone-dependent protoporphyrinogen IX oxidase
MNVLIAYYSWQGHTKSVVEGLASKINASTERIEAVKESNIAIKGMKAYFGFKSDIKPCKTDLSEIDHLVVATPVWAGHPTPYINKYLSLLTNTKGKTFSVVVEMRGSGAEKTLEKIRDALEKKDMRFISSAVTVEEEVEAGEFDQTVSKLVESIKKLE